MEGLYLQDQLLFGQHSVGEDCLRLGEQGLLHLGAYELRRVVPDDEALGFGLLCDGGCLLCGAMAALLGLDGVFLTVGGLVVEQVTAADDGDDALGVDGVGAEGVALARRRLGGQQFVRDDLARLRIGPVIALLDALIVGERDTELLTTVDEQVTVTRLLLEEETCGRDAMMQRDGLDEQRLVFVDHFALIRVEGLERHRHGEVGTEEVEQRTEDPLCIGLRMNDDLAGALAEAEGADQAHQAEAMVTMQMTEQDVPNLAYCDVVAAQTDLHALSAINQEQVATEVDNLTCGGMAQRGLGRAAA